MTTDERSDRGVVTPPHALLTDDARPLEYGEMVGRYVITSRLGAGGMGVVHAAYDPDLDRRLALKLLRRDRYPSAQASRRLLREAQALARVAHPNVVTIHDVGIHRGQVWLAMEFVSGRTLRAWLAAAPRGWREILEVLTAAGHGIAAAHRRGLLHRDIKPDNIMVGDDGRVRVMDFGLARLTTNADEADEAPATVAASAHAQAEVSLTGLGMLVGTPAYMAPELFLGHEADARSDQFGLCATLWEALYGERPFVGDSTVTLETAIVEGRQRSPPRHRRVPTWLRRVCERGLATETDARWPSIDALLDELGRARARTRRRRIASVLASVGLASAGFAGWRQAQEVERRSMCERAAAEIETLWNPGVRGRLEAALRETGAANAEPTIERLLPRLDARTKRWAALREQVCLEAEVQGTRSPALVQRSLDCLADQRDLLASVLEVLLEPDHAAIHRALPALAGLPPLERCVDARALERRPAPPEDPEQREQLEALRRELMRLRGRTAAGDYAEGIADAEELLVRAESLGSPVLGAWIRSTLGLLAQLDGRLERAERAYARAYLDAGALRDDELAAQVAIRLAMLVGVERDRPAEGSAWLQSAEMLVRRLGEEQGLPGATLVAVRAHVELTRGAYYDAQRSYERALELNQRHLGPDHPDVAESLNGLASVLDTVGDYEGARRLYERSLAICERDLGPDHPSVASVLHNLALVRWRQGDGELARELLERALEIWEAAHGPEAIDVASTLHSLAIVDKSMGRYAEARAGFERALAIREHELGPDHRRVAETLNSLAGIDKTQGRYALAQQRYERVWRVWEQTLGPDHPTVASVCNNLGELHRARGDFQRARELHERALAIRERALGPDHASIADSLSNLALLALQAGGSERARELNLRALEMRKRVFGPDHGSVAISLNNLGEVEVMLAALDDAEAHYRRALEIMEANLGAEHLHLSYPLHGLGQVELARGHADEAVEVLERSLALRESSGAGPSDRAEVRFALARALWSSGARSRARAGAEQALDEYRAAERGDRIEALEAWRREH